MYILISKQFLIVHVGQTGITVEAAAARAGIGLDTLSNECSQRILCNLSEFCVDWKLIGKRLGLTEAEITAVDGDNRTCLLYTSPSPRDATLSRMPSSA